MDDRPLAAAAQPAVQGVSAGSVAHADAQRAAVHAEHRGAREEFRRARLAPRLPRGADGPGNFGNGASFEANEFREPAFSARPHSLILQELDIAGSQLRPQAHRS